MSIKRASFRFFFRKLWIWMEYIKWQKQCIALIIACCLPLRIDDKCMQKIVYTNNWNSEGIQNLAMTTLKWKKHMCLKNGKHIGWICFRCSFDIFSIVCRAHDTFQQRYSFHNLWFNGHKCTLHQLTYKTFTAFSYKVRETENEKKNKFAHALRWTVPHWMPFHYKIYTNLGSKCLFNF